MQLILKTCAISSILILTACSSSSSSTSPEAQRAADVQGTWEAPCEVDEDGDASQTVATFNGTSILRQSVRYIDTSTCAGTNHITVNIFGTFAVTEGVTTLVGGDAKHVDINYDNATLSAGADALADLAAAGVTLQDVATNNGINDINNIPVSTYGLPDMEFSIYRVDGNELRIADESGPTDGSTAALRYTQLDANVTLTKR